MEIYTKNLQRAKKLNLPTIRRDLARALRLLGLSRAELSVLFVNSERMRRLNAHYRGIDRPTDVLSFPLLDRVRDGRGLLPHAISLPLGDIVICVPKAFSQAKKYGVSVRQEVLRLLIHGLLHLVGYDHEISPYRKQTMEKKEREILEALQTVA